MTHQTSCQAVQSHSLLVPVGTVSIPATTAPFIARDRFAVNTRRKNAVNIFYLWNDFEYWFLGKEEHPITGSTLHYVDLTTQATDGMILKELGGHERVAITLTEIYVLMRRQKDGRLGPMATNCNNNIFYVRDVHGIVRSVAVGWSSNGWSIDASSIASPLWWHKNSRVFFRGS